MSSPIIIPFDYNPASSSLKTSSYTVPAGKYARVDVINADFSLDATHLYTSFSISVAATYTSGTSYFAPAGQGSVINSMSFTKVSGNAGITSGASVSLINNGVTVLLAAQTRTTNGTTTVATNLAVQDGLMSVSWIAAGAGGAAAETSVTGAGYYFPANAVKSFWVTTGAVLDGSKYMVTLYNKVS